MGRPRRRRRRDGSRRRGGRDDARLSDAPPRAGRLRLGDLQPLHEARPRRRALPRAGRPAPRDGSPARTGSPPCQRAARRPQPALHRPPLQMVGGPVLRDRPEDLRPARRPSQSGPLADSRPRRNDRPDSQRRAAGPPRRRHVLRRPVRRREDGGDPRGVGGGSRGLPPELRAGHRAPPVRRRDLGRGVRGPRVGRPAEDPRPRRGERGGHLRRRHPPPRRSLGAARGSAGAGRAPRLRRRLSLRPDGHHGPAHGRRACSLRHSVARPGTRRDDGHGDARARDGAPAAARRSRVPSPQRRPLSRPGPVAAGRSLRVRRPAAARERSRQDGDQGALARATRSSSRARAS